MSIETTWQSICLSIAGVIGCVVAIVHGILLQRLIIRRVTDHVAATGFLSGASAKLVAPLLQFSTFSWFLGGLTLIGAALWAKSDARLPLCVLVGGLYLYGAVGNCWATRGRHPGWILMSIALALIIMGVRQ